MPNVTVPAEFFRAELRVYSDWRQALARELLQNAVDAHSRRIDIRTSSVDGRAVLEFDDDGDGMTRQVLEEVYFALGRTTKDGDAIGGFGRARIITCFAQRSYEIRTGDLHVHGTGGHYTISDSGTAGGTAGVEPVAGCRFRIELADDDPQRIVRAFTQVLSTCNLPVDVHLNERAIEGYPLPGRAARVFRDEDGRDWAKVYVGRRRIGQLLVRVNGLSMFHRYLPGDDDVIVEVDPKRSRAVLAASRDNLAAGYADQLDAFITDLSGNRLRALRSQPSEVRVHLRGGGLFLTGRPAAAEPSDRQAADQESEQAANPAGGDKSAAAMLLNAGAATHPDDRTPAAGDGAEPQSDTAGLGFDVFLFADDDTPTTRRLLRAWDPRRWQPGGQHRRRALLRAWCTAVNAAIEALQTLQPGAGPVCWTVGWVFDDGVEAAHRTAGNIHVLALHPRPGGNAYRVGQHAGRRKLLALAAHEACHILREQHDETFAAMLTDLYAALDPQAADRAIRAAAGRR